MNKRLLVSLILFLLVIPAALAVDINIKTLPSHRISVIVREAEKLTSLESFHKNTSDGNVKITTTVDKSEIDLLVTLKKDGVNILNEKFESVATNQPININFIPGSVEIILGTPEPAVNETNETENISAGVDAQVNVSEEKNETNIEATQTQTEEVEAEKEKGITGALTDGTKAVFTSKLTYYIIGGIFILGVLVFVVFVAGKKLKGKETYLNFKVKGDKVTESVGKQISDKRLAAAEKKLEEARKELDYIKNRKSRLEEVRKRFEESKKELERLEKGY